MTTKVRKELKKEKMIKVACQHIGEFTTKDHWDEYAKEKALPSSNTYHRNFGSWTKAKETIKTSFIENIHKKES
ncbi:hypothetical protein SAMN05192534_11140 [Alteribacillus persepolensis]|uniref:Uncharacterized protein n=1 Tax=Alteribacillus persepolensis TaxID=568899 RepID=A0A1G8F574_9BACI|nr:hypothetical protein [Alteribacillus persepolensis]SDH77149.1 hypothetical protein SAMN05192534_11140 [Alteribacillus persepolensis]